MASDTDEELADRAAALLRFVCLGRFIELEDACDVGAVAPRLERGVQVARGRPVRFAGHDVYEDEVHAYSLPHDSGERDARRAVGRTGGVGRDYSVGVQHRAIELEVRLEGDFHHAIQALPSRERLDSRGGVLCLPVDDEIGTRLARDFLLLGAAHAGGDSRSAPFRELDRRVSDRAAAARDEHGLSLDATVLEKAAVRGHPGDTEAGSGLEAGSLGKRHRILRRDRDVFGRSAESAAALRLIDPYALAYSRLRYARADLVDDAGSVLMRNYARKRHFCAAVPAAAQFRVGRIDSGKMQLDAHFARRGLWIGQLAENEDFRRGPFALVIRRPHAVSFFASGRL